MPPRTAEPSPLPEGLAYYEEFITVEEERALIDVLDALDFQPVVMRGRTARRSVRHFGLEYSYQRKELALADRIPGPMLFVRDRCAQLLERESEDLVRFSLAGTRLEPASAGTATRRFSDRGSRACHSSRDVACASSGGRTASAPSPSSSSRHGPPI